MRRVYPVRGERDVAAGGATHAARALASGPLGIVCWRTERAQRVVNEQHDVPNAIDDILRVHEAARSVVVVHRHPFARVAVEAVRAVCRGGCPPLREVVGSDGAPRLRPEGVDRAQIAAPNQTHAIDAVRDHVVVAAARAISPPAPTQGDCVGARVGNEIVLDCRFRDVTRKIAVAPLYSIPQSLIVQSSTVRFMSHRSIGVALLASVSGPASMMSPNTTAPALTSSKLQRRHAMPCDPPRVLAPAAPR